MAMRITYPDGSVEIVARATRVDTENLHEGMYDSYDEGGPLLLQIDTHSRIRWELVEEPDDD